MSNSLQQEMEFNTGSKNLKVKMLDKQFQQKNIIEKKCRNSFWKPFDDIDVII